MVVGSTQAHSQNTYLYIADAASGRALSPNANPALPLDVSVDGVCIAKGISYGDILGPYSGAAATYNFVFYTAQTGAPCSGAVAYSATVALAADTTYIGVLSVNASKVLAGQIYTADLSPIPTGYGRYQIINATPAPLNASITTIYGTSAITVEPGVLQGGLLNPNIFTSSIKDFFNNVLAGPITVEVSQRNAYLYVIAGSADDQSVQYLGPKIIRGVF
jgi:hypothetical protein